ncbi:MAG: hypothetical protein ABFD04_11565 [Syntrophomonas sp.]
MDKFEQAIAYFEDAVKESNEIIADCSPDLQAELTRQKGHFVVALEALRERPQGRYVIVEPCHNLSEKLKELRGKCCTFGDVDFDKCQHIQEKLNSSVEKIECCCCQYYDLNRYWCNKFDKPMLQYEICGE